MACNYGGWEQDQVCYKQASQYLSFRFGALSASRSRYRVYAPLTAQAACCAVACCGQQKRTRFPCQHLQMSS